MFPYSLRSSHIACLASGLFGLTLVLSGCEDNTPVSVPLVQHAPTGGPLQTAPAPIASTPSSPTVKSKLPERNASPPEIDSRESDAPDDPATTTPFLVPNSEHALSQSPSEHSLPATPPHFSPFDPSARMKSKLTAADWPQFRGPTGMGVSDHTGLPTTWSETENLVWKTKLPGAGASSPILAGDRVILTYFTGINPRVPAHVQNLKRFVAAFDRRTGAPVWAYEFKTDQKAQPFNGYLAKHGFASSTPATDGTNVYVAFANAGVVAVSMEGQWVWTATTGSKAHAWGSWSSPVLHNGLLILNAAIECGHLGAFDVTGGSVRWHTPGIESCWTSPVLVPVPGGATELVLNTDGRIVGFNPETGEELWSCRGFSGNVVTSIVAHEGVVYATGGRNGLTIAVQAGGRGNVTDSHLLWRAPVGASSTSPVYHDGHLYLIDVRGTAYCLSAVDGQVVIQRSLQTGDIFASPVLADGKLYVVTRERGTFVLSATPELTLMAQNQFASDQTAFNASPAVSEGQLYLRSDRFLYCVGKPPLATADAVEATGLASPPSVTVD